MSSLTGLVGGFAWNKLQSSRDDDWVDRLNHLVTVTVLVLFAVFVAGGQYAGSPIECIIFSSSDVALRTYANRYCWVHNTYYVPMTQSATETLLGYRGVGGGPEELSYYQWVPIILLFLALLYKLPCIIWRLLNAASGLNLDQIVSLTLETQIGDRAQQNKIVLQIAESLDRWLDAHRHYRWNRTVQLKQSVTRHCFFCFGKRDGSYLSGLYLCVKLLYCVNVICQFFFILNGMLGGWYNVFGLELLTGKYFERQGQRQSPYFPKVTLCDFKVWQMGNLQSWTAQCALPINMFNEQIFTFLWFWYILVGCLTVFSFLKFWIFCFLLPNAKENYVGKFLNAQGELTRDEDKRWVGRFAREYLRHDGVFALRVVAHNSSTIIIQDLVLYLWRIYRGKEHLHNSQAHDGHGDGHRAEVVV